MLHLYAFSNFQSFLEPTEVSLKLNDKTAARGWSVAAPSGQRLTQALAALGPNGAGKTALLKPLAFLAWFVRSSFGALKPDDMLPFDPHFSARHEPSEFEVEAEDAEGVLWRYVLRCSQTRVFHEALYRKRERFGYVFVRDWDDARQAYVVKQKDFGMAPAEAQKVRPNASLIATAAQYGVDIAVHVAGIRLFSNINAGGREHFDDVLVARAAELFANDAALKDRMRNLLRSWDLGLTDVTISEMQVTAPAQAVQTIWFPYGVHRSRDGKRFDLPFMQESRGTQAAFVLLSILLPALASGGIALVDEFENDLHPLMLEPILDLFADPKTNPHNAQILFTCHSVEVLNLLHKAQVMLVEKNDCESSAWRFDSMQGVRSDDNFYAKYMAGAYGAVPRV